MNELYEWQFAGAACRRQEARRLFLSDLRRNGFRKAANRPQGGRNSNPRAHARRMLNVVILADPDGNQIVFAHGKAESHRAVK